MASPSMTTFVAPKNQPYSLHLHRDGKVEIIYGQSPNTSHASSSRPRHSSMSGPAPSPSPRSTAATFGSSNTRIAQSIARRESPPSSDSSTKHRDSSTHRHHHHPSETHRSTSQPSHHHLSVSSSSDRHRHHSTSSTEKRSLPIPIPVQSRSQSGSHSHSRSRSHSHTPSPQSSPAKHARFAALPGSVPLPTITASGHLAPPSHSYNPPAPVATSAHPSHSPHQSSSLAVPVSRHRPSTSADSFFFLQAQRPKGWYNRRGDRFVQKGIIELQAPHLQWHPTFGGYPEPGMGWMDEHGRYMPAGGGILKN